VRQTLLRASCRGVTVAARVRPATDFLGRLLGLMFRPPLGPGEGLWLSPCNAVHTAFCRGALDVVFLGGEGRVLRVVPALAPWRVAACRGARSVLEVAPGAASALRPGDRLELDEPPRFGYV
jgi:uncharacterized membrane protein (UPF0127 family)